MSLWHLDNVHNTTWGHIIFKVLEVSSQNSVRIRNVSWRQTNNAWLPSYLANDL